MKQIEYKQIIANVIEERLKVLDDLLKVQTSDGNWNSNAYMHGMANGMILSQSVLENIEPNFLDAPEKWLDNKDGNDEQVSKSN